MRSSSMTRRAALLAIVAALALVLTWSGTAVAMTDAKITVNKDTGGQPARFTFTAITDDDASIDSLEVEFPKGFSLEKSHAVVVTLQGLKRTTVKATTSHEGERFRVAFEPSVAPGSQLRVQIYEVGLPFEGGTFKVKGSYEADGESRPLPGDLFFRYKTMPRSEVVAKWLGEKPIVQWWNESPFLHLFFSPEIMARAIPLLFTGWVMSIGLVIVAFPIAIVGGLALAFMKMSKIPPLRWIAAAYINVIRGTPLFLQIYIAFVGLPIAGFRAPLFVTGVVVLALNSSAYLAEIFRAGIQSIHKGQMEAAVSLGMSYPQAMAWVIIPQTVKRVLPTMTSEFILLFKDTALLSAVGVFELMLYSNSFAVRSGNLTPFVVAAVYYLIVTIPLINWVASLETRLARAEGGGAQDDGETKKRRWLGGLGRGLARTVDPHRAGASDVVEQHRD